MMGKHEKKQTCSACGGSGRQVISDNGNRREITCVACHGSGTV